MSDSAKFVSWLRTKIDEVVREAATSGNTSNAWSALASVEDALEGRLSMVFGAIVSNHVPVLKAELGDHLRHEMRRLEDEASSSVLAALGIASEPPPPKGLFGKLGALFKSPPSPVASAPGPVDEARAMELAKKAGLAIGGLLNHADARARRVAVAAALSHTSASPRLEARLAIETDVEVARALLDRLNAVYVIPKPATATAVEQRFPELKYLLLMGKLLATEQSMVETATNPQTRAEAIAALADPRATRHATERNRLLVDALLDTDLRVSRAAVAGVKTWGLRFGNEQLRTLARGGRTDALEVLASLAVHDPTIAIDLVLENAQRSPPLLTGLATLLTTTRRLSREHLADLEALLPSLPDGPEAAAIRARLGRSRPAVNLKPGHFDELEDAIDASPDDVNAWLVWSDAVQGVGDPRGELVALARAGQSVDDALARALPTLAPELSALFDDPRKLLAGVTLHMGLPKRVVFRSDHQSDASQAQVIAAVMGAPLGRFVREVHLGLTSESGQDNDWADSLDALLATGGRVRSLLLGAFDYPDEMEISWVNWGDLSAVWTLPRLQHLHLRGAGGVLGVVSSPTLETLTIESGGLDRPVLDALLTAKLPALTALTLWTGDPDYGATAGPDDIVALLDRAPAGLVDLGIENCAFTHELVDVLAKHPATKRLRRLSLRNGVLRPSEVDLLISRSEAFRHLERLDLSANLLDDDACERIGTSLGNAIVDEQREDYGDDDDRYVAVGE